MDKNNYWQGKKRGFGQHWSHAAIYTAGFCALSLAIVLPLYKTNHTLVWKLDSLGQYYPAFLYIGRWLRNIFASVTSGHPEISFFDLSIGMGEDVIGSLNYYGLGDPLNLLAALANAGNDAVLFSLLYFLRLYLAGAAFLVYSEYLRFAFRWSALGAYLYTFFGYGLLAGTMYPQFLTPLITFPLVLLGCEKILHHEKPWIFVGAIALTGLASYYFLYIVSLGLIVYALVRTGSLYGEKYGGRAAAGLKSLLTGTCWYFVGVMLSAPFLLPALGMLQGNARMEGDLDLSVLASPGQWIPDMGYLGKYMNGANTNPGTVYWQCVTFIELALLPFILVAYLRHRDARTKQLTLLYLGGTLAWMIPATHYIFSGMAEWYDRWVFQLQAGYVIILEYLLTKLEQFFTAAPSGDRIAGGGRACGNGAAAGRGRAIFSRITGHRLFYCAAAGAVMLNLFWNTYALFSPVDGDYLSQFAGMDELPDYIASPVSGSELISADPGLYRVATARLTDVNGRPENVAMLNGYNGLTFWLSVANSNTQAMVRQLGSGETDGRRSSGLNSSPVYETLAGVKYHLLPRDSTDPVPMGYRLIESVTFSGQTWDIYRNEQYSGMIHFYDQWEPESEYAKGNLMQRMADAADRAILSDGASVNAAEQASECVPLREIPLASVTDAVSESDAAVPADDEVRDGINGGRPGNDVKDGMTAVVPADSEAWVLRDANLPDSIKVTVNGRELAPGCLLNVGYHEYEERLALVWQQSSDGNEAEAKAEEEADADAGSSGSLLQGDIAAAIHVYALDSNDYQKLITRPEGIARSDYNLADQTFRANQFNAHTDTLQDSIAVIALPYSRNWHAAVDGSRTDILRANTMYCAIELPAGPHDIILQYVPSEFYAGCRCAVAAVILMVIQLFLSLRAHKKA